MSGDLSEPVGNKDIFKKNFLSDIENEEQESPGLRKLKKKQRPQSSKPKFLQEDNVAPTERKLLDEDGGETARDQLEAEFRGNVPRVQSAFE